MNIPKTNPSSILKALISEIANMVMQILMEKEGRKRDEDFSISKSINSKV